MAWATSRPRGARAKGVMPSHYHEGFLEKQESSSQVRRGVRGNPGEGSPSPAHPMLPPPAQEGKNRLGPPVGVPPSVCPRCLLDINKNTDFLLETGRRPLALPASGTNCIESSALPGPSSGQVMAHAESAGGGCEPRSRARVRAGVGERGTCVSVCMRVAACVSGCFGTNHSVRSPPAALAPPHPLGWGSWNPLEPPPNSTDTCFCRRP